MITTRVCPTCHSAVASRWGRVCPVCTLSRALTPEPADEPAERRCDSLADVAGSTASQSTIPFGDYDLLDELGRGGSSVVYRARQRGLGRVVALKALLAGPLASPDALRRFRAEASIAAGLQHPNIVAVHEVGVRDGRPYLVMDYVAGPTLAQLADGRPLEPNRAARYVRSIAEAVHHAHERGLLHRDLKPANVLVDPFDQPQVTDFGLAKRLVDPSPLSSLHSPPTLSGQILGTPNYLPPEQAAADHRAVSRHSDVYGLGGILYHLLTGRAPFLGATVNDTLAQVLNADPVAPHVLNPAVPRDLETICLKCLEKEPSRRYTTALELTDDLGRFSEGEAVMACPPSAAYRLQKIIRRHRAVSMAIVLVTLTVLLGGAVSTWALIRERGARVREQTALYQATRQLGAATNFIAEVFNRVAPEIANLAGAANAQETLAQAGLKFVQNLRTASGDDPALRIELARLLLRLSEAQNSGMANSVGDYASGLQRAKETLEILNDDSLALSPVERQRLQYQARWAETQCLAGLGRWDESTARMEELEPMIDALARLPEFTQKWAEGQRLLLRMNAGACLIATGRPELMRQAIDQHFKPFLDTDPAKACAKALDSCEEYDLRSLACAQDNLASAYGLLGEFEAMTRHAGEAIPVIEALARRFPRNARYEWGGVFSRAQQGWALLRTGRTHGLEILTEARRQADDLVIKDASNDQFQSCREMVLAIQAAALAGWSEETSVTGSERRRRLTQAETCLGEAQGLYSTVKSKEPEIYLKIARDEVTRARTKLAADEQARATP